MVRVLLPLRTWSEPNVRVHWAKRARRVREQRSDARTLVRAALSHEAWKSLRSGEARIVVTLTRIGPRTLDSDNLAASLKAVRDGIADAIALDDGDPRFDWRYAQKKGKPYAVTVEIG